MCFKIFHVSIHSFTRKHGCYGQVYVKGRSERRARVPSPTRVAGHAPWSSDASRSSQDSASRGGIRSRGTRGEGGEHGRIRVARLREIRMESEGKVSAVIRQCSGDTPVPPSGACRRGKASRSGYESVGRRTHSTQHSAA